MRIAVDLEEVLADTISAACNSTDKLDHEDFETWDLDDYTWQVYAGVSDALWRHNPSEIQRVEPNVEGYMLDLYDSDVVDQLDIVTARMHVDDSVRRWLDGWSIMYDDIISTRAPKCSLDYDLYIDDNPEMVGRCRLLLRHHPHNDSVDTTRYKSVDRIHSLAEVSDFL